jgi:very-short-patch-repair endonuclease
VDYLRPPSRIEGAKAKRKVDKSRLYELASGQHGVFTTKQALSVGIDHRCLHRMVATGQVVRMWARVYRLVGVPQSTLQRIAAAQAWGGEGSAISHDTAAWMLDLCDRSSSQIHLTRRRITRPPNPKIVAHRSDLTPSDISTVQGIPVTTMPRTVIDIAAVSAEEVVDIALDAAIRQGMSRSHFLRRLDVLARPGRNGIAVVKKLVAERAAEQGLTESTFERLLLRALKRAGLPLPVCQMTIGQARVDFAYPDHALVIEADSYRWHDGRAAWERHRRRVSELAARGWRVLLVTWLQLKYRPDEVVDRIRRALGVTA